MEQVGNPRFIHDVIAGNSRVVLESSGNDFPELHHLVLDSFVVIPKQPECRSDFWRCVEEDETYFAALGQKWIAVFIFWPAERFHALTLISPLKDLAHKRVWHFMLKFWRIKMRNAIAAQLAREHILVVVEHHVDAILGKAIYELLDFVQVFHVVDAGCRFDGFPHDADADEFEAEVAHVHEVFVGHAHVEIVD